MKCIKDIKRYKIRYNFGSYPDLAYEVSTRRSIPDIIADSFIRPDDNFSLKDNKMCIVGRTFETFRYDYIIEDRQKFDKAVTKYCIIMVSEWRVVAASTTGTIDAYLTIENLNGDRVDLFFSELSQINEKIIRGSFFS